VSSLVPDELDRAIVHALHIDGRAPFSRIASVLDVSDQTVARSSSSGTRELTAAG
jgi:DNA-binding Lrp family transcriptional regulator